MCKARPGTVAPYSLLGRFSLTPLDRGDAGDAVLDLWATLDSGDLAAIIGLSLAVSLSATVLAALIGLPLGGVLAVYAFPGRRALTVAVNGFLGLPPVVVGLALYLLLSRAGPKPPTLIVAPQTAAPMDG